MSNFTKFMIPYKLYFVTNYYDSILFSAPQKPIFALEGAVDILVPMQILD